MPFLPATWRHQLHSGRFYFSQTGGSVSPVCRSPCSLELHACTSRHTIFPMSFLLVCSGFSSLIWLRGSCFAKSAIRNPQSEFDRRRGWDYPKLRFGSSLRASPLTRAPKAPHRSNGVRISCRRAAAYLEIRVFKSPNGLARRGWDSNPRGLSACRFSRPEPSTTRPPLRWEAPVILPSRSG